MFPILVTLVALLSLQNVQSMFEEQVGMNEWLIENTGVIENARYSSDSLLSIGKEGIISRISNSNGVALWRHFLPDNSFVFDFLVVPPKFVESTTSVSDEHVIVVHARDVEFNPFSQVSISAFNSQTGVFLWESVVTSSRGFNSTFNRSNFNLILDASKNYLYLRCFGDFFIFSASGNILFEHSEKDFKDSQNNSYSIKGLFPLNSLNSISSKDSSFKPNRVGLACSHNGDFKCKDIFLISHSFDSKSNSHNLVFNLNKNENEINVERFVSGVKSNKWLSNAGQSQKYSTLENNEFIFSVGEDNLSVLVFDVNGSIHSIPIPHSSELSSVTAELYEENNKIFPAIKTCSSKKCELFLIIKSISKDTEGNEVVQFELNSVAICESVSQGYFLFGFDFSLNSVGLTLPSHATCVSELNHGDGESSTQLQISQFSINPTRKSSIQTWKLTIPHMRVAKFKSVFSHESNLVLVSSSGCGLSVKLSGQQGQIVWIRDESLSQVRSASMVEASKTLTGNKLETMPDLITRLKMQWQELMNFGLDLKDRFEDLPNEVKKQAFIVSALYVEPYLEIARLLAQSQPIPQKREINHEVYELAGKVNPFVSPRDRRERRRSNSLLERQERVTSPFLYPSTCPSSKKRSNIAKERVFGLDQVVVALSSPVDLSVTRSSGVSGVPLNSLGVRVVGLSTLTNNLLWSLEPVVPLANSEDEVTWVELLSLPSHIHHSHVQTQSLVVATKEGKLYIWEIDSLTGHTATTLKNELSPSCQSQYRISSPSKVLQGVPGVRSIQTIPQTTAFLLTSNTGKAFKLCLDVNGCKEIVMNKIFTHSIDKRSGLFETFKVNSCSKALDSSLLTFECSLTPVASSRFDPSVERIASVSFAGPSLINEAVDSRFDVLGDDSVLLKYMNPHALLVISTSAPSAPHLESMHEPLFTVDSYGGPVIPLCGQSGYESQSEEESQQKSPCTLYATLIDSVSGKIIYRMSHLHGCGPVHSIISENTLIYSYWNAHLKRQELSVIGLYEGIIDRLGLTPFASHSSAQVAALYTKPGAGNHSSFSATTPLASQRTYVLPRSVTSLGVSLSRAGLSPLSLFISQSSQVFSLDYRLIHPRRPLQQPSVFEREEGLNMYSPFTHLSQDQALTIDREARNIRKFLCSPTRLESTSLVLSIGTDLHFARVRTGGGFDQLAEDFNHVLLIFILTSLAVLTLVLNIATKRKRLATAWA